VGSTYIIECGHHGLDSTSTDKGKHGNTEDWFDVAVVKKCVGDTDARTAVGYLPREVSQDLWYFLGHGGEIEWEVTGRGGGFGNCLYVDRKN